MESDSAAQQIRAQQLKHWDHVAGGWATWLEWTERHFSPVGEWFCQMAGWAPGRQALDVACGAGYPALLGASHVQPGGTMVAVDISRAMIAAASKRAADAGHQNIEFLQMDAEALRFEPASFDAVTNAYGLMFCPDPQRAVNEGCRVLKEGGRLALATWDEPSKSPFFSVITPVAAPVLSLVAPEPDAPGPFRLSSPTRLDAMLRAAGCSDVRVESRPATFEFASVAEYIRIFSDLAWKSRLAALSRDEFNRFQDAVEQAAQPCWNDGRLRLTATSLCAAGRKA